MVDSQHHATATTLSDSAKFLVDRLIQYGPRSFAVLGPMIYNFISFDFLLSTW